MGGCARRRERERRVGPAGGRLASRVRHRVGAEPAAGVDELVIPTPSPGPRATSCAASTTRGCRYAAGDAGPTPSPAPTRGTTPRPSPSLTRPGDVAGRRDHRRSTPAPEPTGDQRRRLLRPGPARQRVVVRPRGRVAGRRGRRRGRAGDAARTPRVGDGWRTAYLRGRGRGPRPTVTALDAASTTRPGASRTCSSSRPARPLEPGPRRRGTPTRAGSGWSRRSSTDGPATSPAAARQLTAGRATPAAGSGCSPPPARAATEPAAAAGLPGSAPAGSATGRACRVAWAGGRGLPLLERLPLLRGVVPLPAVLDDRLLLPGGLLGRVLLVPLLLELVGRAVAGHRRGRGPGEVSPEPGTGSVPWPKSSG